MRVLGLDYGDRRIGVALGDTESRIASPWTVVDVKRDFGFSPNGEFNVQLNGGELTQFTAALGTGAAPYVGALTGNGITLNASSDASTVTVSSLNVASPTNLSSLALSAPNGALRVQSMTVPTSQSPDDTLSVSVTANGDLAVDSYTRTPFPGGLNGSTSFASRT